MQYSPICTVTNWWHDPQIVTVKEVGLGVVRVGNNPGFGVAVGAVVVVSTVIRVSVGLGATNTMLVIYNKELHTCKIHVDVKCARRWWILACNNKIIVSSWWVCVTIRPRKR